VRRRRGGIKAATIGAYNTGFDTVHVHLLTLSCDTAGELITMPTMSKGRMDTMSMVNDPLR